MGTCRGTEVNLRELVVFSFHLVGLGDHTLLIRLGGKHLYLLSYLAVLLLRM